MTKRRVLFVDDEPNIIEGLRRMLRKQRAVWDMEFVPSGAAALAKMAASPFDVIITDLQMPDMDGAALLERVVADHPATARLVLSGHADENMTKRALNLAHRFLAKPTDSDTLMAAVAEACGAQQSVPDDRMRGLVAGCDALPSAPDLYIQITQAAESETADAAVIGKIISRDMAMSAKLLQLVNSSFFGIARRVSSIEQTVALLGIIRIKALVLTEQIFKQFKPAEEIPQVRVTRLWQHSICTAEMARELCRLEQQGGDRPDQAFTAGLLHDVGLLVLASQQIEGLKKVCKLALEHRVPAHTLEREVLGATHAEVGAYLLRLWGLPPRIVEAVELHHTPGDVQYDGLCAVTVVHAADVLERTLFKEGGAGLDDVYLTALDQAYLTRIGLADRAVKWRDLANGLGSKFSGSAS